MAPRVEISLVVCLASCFLSLYSVRATVFWVIGVRVSDNWKLHYVFSLFIPVKDLWFLKIVRLSCRIVNLHKLKKEIVGFIVACIVKTNL